MLIRTLVSAILALLLTGQAGAQRADLPAISSSTGSMTATAPPFGFSADDDAVNTALKTVSAWISGVFNLPEPRLLPEVRRVLPQISSLSLIEPTQSDARHVVGLGRRSPHESLVGYDENAKTIYLAASWTGSTPAEMSALVHAMARHFQSVGHRQRYDCPEQRNALPYDAQARWLGLYELALQNEFGIGADALMVHTQCIP